MKPTLSFDSPFVALTEIIPNKITAVSDFPNYFVRKLY